MNIIYLSKDSARYKDLKRRRQDFVALLADDWDDYGYKSTLNVTAFIDSKEIDLPRLKIAFKDKGTTYKILDDLLAEGWNGIFPIEKYDYISVPTSTDFYELIISKVGAEQALSCARSIHDASVLVFMDEDPVAMEMIKGNVFSSSLQRSRASEVVFHEGWALFGDRNILVEDFSFKLRIQGDTESLLDFKFNDSILPYDINILIGPNGSGKSQTLQRIVKSWLMPQHVENWGDFSSKINISKLVVVSYSPFELFPVDLIDVAPDIAAIDTTIYSYFGLRQRKGNSDNPQSEITLSREHAKVNAAISLLNCAKDDIKFGAIKNWSNKIKTMKTVLSEAVNFDFAALEIDDGTELDQICRKVMFGSPIVEYEGKKYFKIDDAIDANYDLLESNIIAANGVSFFKDGSPLQLSSGQRLFSYIVINIIGSIKKNSLIIVDEPELFLHPTLEIAFIGMLKKILTCYFSKAILATHSVVTAREVPKKCIHIFQEESDITYINNPPFETFGGDIQRISSYVFGDKAISKPYEDWITKKLEEFSAEELILALGQDINEEMIVQIHAMGKDKWL